MIGCFPTPYPDELLYSICARFSDRVSYVNSKATLVELFGAATASAVVDLPNRLNHLAAALPRGTSLTVERLINQFTLFPFFTAFLPPERVQLFRGDMATSSGPSAHMRSGVMASSIPVPAFLRFCPACKREDEECYGETYWHRLHQLPGVEVCPIHQTFLENSAVGLRANRKHLQFISAKQSTRSVPAQLLGVRNRDHQALLQAARDAKWLLSHPTSGISLELLYGRYLRLLVARRLATYTGSIHVKKILAEFTAYYSPSLLKLLHCELRGGDVEKSNWLLRLARPPKHAQHPLYHLLLIQFLGCTAKEFFQLPEELRPFGEGPWPCLNTAASHYKQFVIMECQLGDRLRYGKLAGKFSCECGFAYARTGPDFSPEDRFHVGRVISFGPIWEAKLKQLWKDSSLSLSEVGRQLSVDPLTVRRHAAQLKLPFSGLSRKSKLLNRTAQLKGQSISAAREKKRYICRSKWLSVIRRNPKITLMSLRRKFPREYAWLLQHDSEWLDGNKPRPQRRNLSTTCVDWKRRDAEYAVAVRDAATRLKDTTTRPVRVTRTAIGRAIGAVTLLQQKLRKMPLTAQVLAGVVETREECAVRRVWWAVDLYCQEDVLPREWQLIGRANVYNLRETSKVISAIQGAIHMLRLKLSQRKSCDFSGARGC